MAKRNDAEWQYVTIVIPAGVGIIRSRDNHVERRSQDLRCKARRRIVNGRAATDLWFFDWVGVEHYVTQEEVVIYKK